MPWTVYQTQLLPSAFDYSVPGLMELIVERAMVLSNLSMYNKMLRRNPVGPLL